MSYSLEIAAKARESLSELEPWLQEETLDEIERLTREPSLLVSRGIRPGLVHDFIRVRNGFAHYVFLVVELNRTAGLISVRQIGHVFH